MGFLLLILFLFGFFWFFKKNSFLRNVFAILAVIFGGIFALIIGLIGAILLPIFFKGNILNNQFSQMKGGYAEYLVALIAKIAKLDGVISPKEAEFIKLILDKNSYNLIERERLKKVFKEAKENPNNYKEVAIKLQENFTLSKNEKLNIMYSLLYCAGIDGVSKTKFDALREIAGVFGVLFEFEQLLNHQNSTQNQRFSKDPYEVLEVPKDASFTQIKSAYKKLVRKYHPDILNTQNLSKEELEKGVEKFHEINEAYEILKKKFNEK